MAKLSSFSFYSISTLDDDSSETNFIAKGYVDYREDYSLWYFKHENEYKFIIRRDELEVCVDNSSYNFNVNKKTEAFIKIDNYSYKASITTNSLIISEEEININYVMDFSSFKGNYKIIVKLC